MDDDPDTGRARGYGAAQAERFRIQRVRWYLDAEARRESVPAGRLCACEDCEARRRRTHRECACCGTLLRAHEREPGLAMCGACRQVARDLKDPRLPAASAVNGLDRVADASATVRAARSAIHLSREAAEARRRETP